MAEWLGRALQKLVQRFESAFDLNFFPLYNFGYARVFCFWEGFISSHIIKPALIYFICFMRPYYPFALLLTTLLFASSCLHIPDKPHKPLCASWKVTRIEEGENEDEATGVRMFDMLEVRMKDGYIHLYDTGTYTMFGANTSSLGQWKYSKRDSLLMLTYFSDTNAIVFKVLEYDKTWLKLGVSAFAGKPTIAATPVLLKEDPHFEYKQKDLMAPGLNSWRKRPLHAETDAEIRKRLIAHIDYLIAYFEMTTDNGQGFFEQWHLETPIRFYSNGIATPAKGQPKTWLGWFYNDVDAARAAEIIGDAMHSINKYPANTSTFTEAYIIALKEMKEYLRR